MTSFMLSEDTTAYLTLIIMTLVVLFYLVQIKHKKNHTWCLIGYFCSSLVIFIFGFLTFGNVNYPLDFFLQAMPGAGLIGSSLFLLKFSYLISKPVCAKKEFRMIFSLYVFLAGVIIVLAILFTATGDYFLLRGLAVIVLTASLLCLFVFFIQLKRISREIKFTNQIDIEKKRACHMLKQILLLILIPVLLISFLSLSVTLKLINQLFFNMTAALLAIFFIFSFALIYINYIEEQLTFMAKIVFISLMTILITLSLAGYIIVSPLKASFSNTSMIREKTTILFSRQGNDYGIVCSTYHFDPGNSEEVVSAAEQEVHLNFSFPFYAKQYDTIYIGYDGYILLGKNSAHNRIHKMMLPLIAPLSSRFGQRVKLT